MKKQQVTERLKKRYELLAIGSTNREDTEQQAFDRLCRELGAANGLLWLAEGFGLFGAGERFIDKSGKADRFGKPAFLRRIEAEVILIEEEAKTHGHTLALGNGYSQVRGKGSELNQLYGRWRELLDVVDFLELR